ncbi:unnamed protein product (macronuclear) [Paramecium tetraurelia]|uniref:Uncharacterized protein n=1 Tax=Paramecium tetraurelia TaxID=5888 RepID=A0E6M4_PARTE|nr:uncharacterized protein GSPATT00003806001 [Paramecium tetraurelia]CAK90941.1 unnamed protein product [Paramecium tetraurelia]|eukprot:XP_001458338.1 hypothetical protein (macronuclear) [Paramecium tetraurelia strain d4-2]
MNLQLNIQQEVARFADINHIYETVQKKGYLSQISKEFEDIFMKEINFAQQRLREVISVMEKQGQKIEYNLQLSRNLQIFKSNFDVIVTATMNQIWNRLLIELNVLGQDQQSQIFNIDTSQTVKRVNDLTKQSVSDFKKFASNQSICSRSPSKMSSKVIPLSEMSYQSNGSPTTFPKARRQLDNSLTTSSPGVGKYKLDQSLKLIRETSPNATIGKAPKISWIDEKIKNEDSQSPGPIYDPVKTFCSKKIK